MATWIEGEMDRLADKYRWMDGWMDGWMISHITGQVAGSMIQCTINIYLWYKVQF